MAGPTDYNYTPGEFQERYAKLGDIAETQMSRVWLVHDNKYNRKVAMKLLFPQGIPSKSKQMLVFQKRFLQEVQVAAQLNHPNAIKIYEYGICNKFHFVTMDYVEGKNLRKAMSGLRESSSFSLEEFLVLFYQMCDPIEWAHKKGVIHRDLKPLNVLLGKAGQLVVCDWGIAKILLGEQESDSSDTTSKLNFVPLHKTAPNTLIGTPSYLSPEQIRARKLDKRTDVYQLGAILYEGITGDPPFGETLEDVRFRQSTDFHDYEMPENIDSGLQHILALSMAVEKKDRYQSVTELRQDLKYYLDDLLNNDEAGNRKQRLMLSDIVKKWIKA